MFNRFALATLLFSYLCITHVCAMQQTGKRFNSAKEFAQALEEPQSQALRNAWRSRGYGLASIILITTGIAQAILLPTRNLPESLHSTSQLAFVTCIVSGLGCACYGSHLQDQAKTFRTTRELAHTACPECLRAVVKDTEDHQTLDGNITWGILNALRNKYHAGLCEEHAKEVEKKQ